MPGKPIDDPLPTTTYAGFAASTPSPAADDAGPARGGAAPGIVRTYPLSDLRRAPAPRRLSPLLAGAALATTFVVGAAAGLALLNGPASVPAAPTPAPQQAAPAPAADVGPAPAPLALTVTEPPTAPAPSRPRARRHAAPRPAVAKTPPSEAAPSAAAPSCGRLDCQEAGLDMLDQELHTAYAKAIRSGAAAGPLSAQQELWAIRQERLRRDDPAMAADRYQARIAELRALAARGDEANP